MTKIKIMLLMMLFFKLFTIQIDAFMINKKPFSEFLFYFESAIIFEGRLHVSTTWICNGICLYVLIMTKRMSALVALILIQLRSH